MMQRVWSRVVCHTLLAAALLLLTGCSLMQRNIGPAPTATSPAAADSAPTDGTSTTADTPLPLPTASLPELAYDMAGLQAQHPDVPYDALLLDRLLIHTISTLDAARQASTAATDPALVTLVETIAEDQRPRVEQLQTWRNEWYPDTPITAGAGMTMVSLVLDNSEAEDFDQQFTQGLVPHLEGVQQLAADAQRDSEQPELQALAAELETQVTIYLDTLRGIRDGL